MRWRLLSGVITGLLVLTGSVGAQVFLPARPAVPALSGSTPDLSGYRAGEFSFASIGTDSMTVQTPAPFSDYRIKQSTPLGTGGAANYFFSRYLGVSVDAYSKDMSHNFVDTTSGNLIARFPIAQTGVAPYFFGGNNYRFDAARENQTEGGAGLEFRFPDQAGTLLDVSYVLPNKTDNYGIGRVGLRFNF